MSRGKILFQLSGSIACYKACHVISRLVQDDYEVRVIATQNTLNFIGPATLEGLTGAPPQCDTFGSGQMMDHIRLMNWADLVILCPASANSIAKLASGLADDLVGTLFLAYDFKKPYLLAPAMNSRMLRHPATQRSLETLKSWGLRILETETGNLACGESGEGRLLDPDTVYASIEKWLLEAKVGNQAAPSPSARSVMGKAESRQLRILMTAGGTREPIDAVRSIANLSTGRTGARIADTLHGHGHRITFLHARDAARPLALEGGMESRTFETFADLETLLKSELTTRDYDAVIHMAAVSDYAVDSIATEGLDGLSSPLDPRKGKIDSDTGLILKLKRHPKLVDRLREQSRNPRLMVVAFKLTHTESAQEREQAVSKLAEGSGADVVVHNDLHDIDTAVDRHAATVYVPEPPRTNRGRGDQNLRIAARTSGRTELAEAIEYILLQKLANPSTHQMPFDGSERSAKQ